MATVLTVGTFDLFHSGHVALLRHCRGYAGAFGRVVVGVNTDRFASTFKRTPINVLAERKAVLGSCRYVNSVIENDSPCLEPLIFRAGPSYLLIGSDWGPPRDYLSQIGTTAEYLASHRVQLVFVPRTYSNQSSTKIRQRVIDNG